MSDPTERPSFTLPAEPPAEPAPTRDAATVVVVRDGDEGLEVFMLQRTMNSDFVGGAYVFPGGTVDPDDLDPSWEDRTLPLSEDLRRCLGDLALPLVVCAIRETFEEAGILLARTRDGEPVRLLDDDLWDRRRDELNARSRSFANIIEEAEVVLDPSLLRYWSRLVTPLSAPKRYDARFFVARMPEGQDPLHDDMETTDSVWIRPSRAVEDGRAGRFMIIFPTRRTLEAVDEHADAASVFAAAEDRDPAPLTPEVVLVEGIPKIALPGGTIHDL
ncbi:MAG: NUDIX hydrolase [Actinomycetota bacterium]